MLTVRVVSVLPERHPDLALVVPVHAEPQPHDPVEAVLVTVPEAHQGHLTQVVRPAQRQLRDRRSHPVIVAPGSDIGRSGGDLGSVGAFPPLDQRGRARRRRAGPDRGPRGLGRGRPRRGSRSPVPARPGPVRTRGPGPRCAGLSQRDAVEVPAGPARPGPAAPPARHGRPAAAVRGRSGARVRRAGGHAGAPARAPERADDRLLLDPWGLDTYDSCVRARDVYGVDRVVVVTQTYHLPRAVGTARLLGLDAVGVGDRTVRLREDGPGSTNRGYVGGLAIRSPA